MLVLGLTACPPPPETVADPCVILTEERAEKILGGPVRAIAFSDFTARHEGTLAKRGDPPLGGGLRNCQYRLEGDEPVVRLHIDSRSYKTVDEFEARWLDDDGERVEGIVMAAAFGSRNDGADKSLTVMVNTTQGVITLATYDAPAVTREVLLEQAGDVVESYRG